MSNRPWTENELSILLSSKSKNPQIEGRSKKAIHSKLIELGVHKPSFKVAFHNKIKWTEAEIKILREAKDKSYLYLPQRSKYAISKMLSKLELRKKAKFRKPWSKKDESILKKLVSEGKTPSDIVRMKIFNYSRNSIQKKMCYLGLAKKSPKKIEVFSKELLPEFKKFLQDNWVGKTPEELVDLWNEQSSVKTNYKKTLYHLRILNIKIPYAEVAIINNLKKKEEYIKSNQSSHRTTKFLSDSIRLARAEVMRKRMIKNRDIWSGLPLSDDLIIERDCCCCCCND